MLERQRRKVIAAVTPHLEPGETVQAAYIGQSPIPPITYLLVGPLLFFFILKFRTFVATERNVYVFPHAWMRSYKYSGEPYKVPLSQARLETGSMWVSLDGGPKSWVMPFGPVKKALVELRDYVASAQSGGAGPAIPAPAGP